MKGQRKPSMSSKGNLLTTSTAIFDGPPPHYSPEDDEGAVEYKWKLTPSQSPHSDRFERLLTQMLFRLREGGGRCVYRIGVADCGIGRGIPWKTYAQSRKVLCNLAIKAAAVVVETHRYCFEGKDRPVAPDLARLWKYAEKKKAASEFKSTGLLFCGEFQVRHMEKSTEEGRESGEAGEADVSLVRSSGVGALQGNTALGDGTRGGSTAKHVREAEQREESRGECSGCQSGTSSIDMGAFPEVALIGLPNSGKTTLMAVLLTCKLSGESEEEGKKEFSQLREAYLRPIFPGLRLDDGQGCARQRLLSHRHEIETGRTSCPCVRVWKESSPTDSVHSLPFGSSSDTGGAAERSTGGASRLLPLVLADIGDGVTKSMLFTLLNRSPCAICICVSARILASTSKLHASLLPFLHVAYTLPLPVILVVTKCDEVRGKDALEDDEVEISELDWDNMLLEVITFIESHSGYLVKVQPELTALPLCKKNSAMDSSHAIESDQAEAVQFVEATGEQLAQEKGVLPLVCISSVTGSGLLTLVHLFSVLFSCRTPLKPEKEREPLLSPETDVVDEWGTTIFGLSRPKFLPQRGFEMSIEDVRDAKGVRWKVEGVVDESAAQEMYLAIRGYLREGEICVGEACVLGPVGSSDTLIAQMVPAGRIVDLIAKGSHEMRLETSTLSSGELLWVILAVGAGDGSRSSLTNFLNQFQRRRRKPKGRVLLSAPVLPYEKGSKAMESGEGGGTTASLQGDHLAVPVAGIPTIATGCDLLLEPICIAPVDESAVWLPDSCEPLLIGRYGMQAVRFQWLTPPPSLLREVVNSNPSEARQSNTSSPLSVRCHFLFHSEMLWVGEVVFLHWAPERLGIGRVTRLLVD